MTAPVVAFAHEVLGVSLWPRQAQILAEIYGAAVAIVVLSLGRRSGKSTLAAVIAVYEALVQGPRHLAAVRPGEQVAIVIISKTQRQARVVHRDVKNLLAAAVRAGRLRTSDIVRSTADEIELASGIVIVTLPCNAAGARGGAVAVVLLDEIAHWQGSDGSPLDPRAVWEALVPSTAQFPERRIVAMSTPRWATGFWAGLVENAVAGAVATMRAWRATTREMNPTLPDSFFAEERAVLGDSAFRREYEASFEGSLTAALDADSVRAALRDPKAPADLPPSPAVSSYLVVMDPAAVQDRWSLIVLHREDGGRVIVDRVKAWRGSRGRPIPFEQTLDEVAAISQAYHGAAVITDQYAAYIILERLRARGVRVTQRPWTVTSKLSALGALRRLLYGGLLEIPRHPELVAELTSLEIRPLPSGAGRIAAPPGGTDDFVTALMAGAAALGRVGMTRVLSRDPETGRTTLDYVEAGEWHQQQATRREHQLAWGGHYD